MRLNTRARPVVLRSALGTAIAAALAAGLAFGQPAPATAAPVKRPMSGPLPGSVAGRPAPQETVTLSIGRGQLVKLPATMSDLFVANDNVADVQVKSNTALYVFGKAAGETNVYATDRTGAVVWSATVRVGQNIASVGQMLKLAMPDAVIAATPMNGLVLLTGTVASPDDVAEAQRLAQAFVGDATQVVSRVKAATPLQVNLQVRIAEVSRDFLKNVGVNLLTQDTTGGFNFGIAQGGSIDVDTGEVLRGEIGSTLAFAGRLFGLNLTAALDLAENNGLVTTLANPNLTALSGETASFLAGGEIPIPISQGLGAVSVEYKQYGVSLSFTPFVLSDGRISMRVRPEVSQLTSAGSVSLNGFTVPGLTTRRAETTIELGSGQSFVIGGLLQNTQNNALNKAPFLGDLPVLGALFRSNSFRRSETELMIVVTPYLVKPVDAAAIRLPTDGYKAPTDFQRVIGGQLADGETGGRRPVPTMAPPVTAAPGSRAPIAAAPPRAAGSSAAVPAPGFSF